MKVKRKINKQLMYLAFILSELSSGNEQQQAGGLFSRIKIKKSCKVQDFFI
jgi:hypothetical protein